MMDKFRSVGRYSSMHMRIGVIDDRLTGMEWMDTNYDTRTFREVTENAKVIEFLRHLLIVLIIDTPNFDCLGNSLGCFTKSNNIIKSDFLYNKEIYSILMFPLYNSKFDAELRKMEIRIKKGKCSKAELISLFNEFSLKVNEQDRILLAGPVKVSSDIIQFTAELHIKAVMDSHDFLQTLTAEYKNINPSHLLNPYMK